MRRGISFGAFVAPAAWPQASCDKHFNKKGINAFLVTFSFVNIAVSVNGKLRNTIKVALDSAEEDVKEKAFNDEKVARHLEGKEIVKVIVVPNKIVNIVVK